MADIEKDWRYERLSEDGKVVIYNPDRGRYRVSKSVFGSLYSGTAFADGMPQDLEVS